MESKSGRGKSGKKESAGGWGVSSAGGLPVRSRELPCFLWLGLFFSSLCVLFLLNAVNGEKAFGQESTTPPAGAAPAPIPATTPLPAPAGGAAVQATPSSEEAAGGKEEKALSLGANAEVYSNMYSVSAYEREAGLSLGMDASYSLNKELGLSTSARINKEFQGAGDTQFYDLPVYLKYREYQGKLGEASLSLNGTLIGILPTDQLSRRDYTFYGGLGVRQDVVLHFDDLKVPISVVLAGSIVRNFHEYNMGYDGRFNVQYALKGALTLGFQFLENLGFSVSTAYSDRFNYNLAESHSFSTDGSLDYGFNKKVSVSAGVSNQGNMLQSDGHSSNFSYFRESSSQLHMGIGIRL